MPGIELHSPAAASGGSSALTDPPFWFGIGANFDGMTTETNTVTWNNEFVDPAIVVHGDPFVTVGEDQATITFNEDCTVVFSIETAFGPSSDAAGWAEANLGGTLASDSPYLVNSMDSFAFPIAGGGLPNSMWTSPPLHVLAGQTLSVRVRAQLSAGTIGMAANLGLTRLA